MVRNVVDHGLETPEEPPAAGKAPRASLELRAGRKGREFRIEIQDDGRGIDWPRVRERAILRDLPAEAHEDLVRALFARSVSTRETVSETSGRGVGLNAVLQEVERLGGSIDVVSVPGAGSCVILRIPAAARNVRGPELSGSLCLGTMPARGGTRQVG